MFLIGTLFSQLVVSFYLEKQFSYIITHDKICLKHERVSVFVLHKLLGLKRQRGGLKRERGMRSKGGKGLEA